MDTTKQREEFEQSMHRTFSGTALDMRRAQAGDYMSWEMNVAWEAYQLAWQAAIASIEIELPDESEEKYWVEHKDGMSSVFQLRHYDLDLKAALHKAGLRVKS